MLYMASYDLTKPGRDYTDLTTTLRALGAVRVLESEWIFASQQPAVALRDQIIKDGKLDANDRILVCELTGVAAWRSLLVDNAAAMKIINSR